MAMKQKGELGVVLGVVASAGVSVTSPRDRAVCWSPGQVSTKRALYWEVLQDQRHVSCKAASS